MPRYVEETRYNWVELESELCLELIPTAHRHIELQVTPKFASLPYAPLGSEWMDSYQNYTYQ